MIEVESPVQRLEQRGRRSVVIAIVAALVAGTGGFLIGRSADEANPRVGAVPSTTAATDEPADTSPSVETVAPVPTTMVLPPPLASDGAVSADSRSAGGPGMYAASAYEESPMELLATRETPSGVVITAYINRYPDDIYSFGGPPGWAPAGWCFPRGDMRVSIVAPTSVNLSYAAWYGKLQDGLAVTTFASGYVEGAPIFGAVVQADPDVASVTMTTGSGLTDSTEPVNGLALLQVDGPIDQDITFTVTKVDGTSSVKPVAELTQPYMTSAFHDACDPPPPDPPDAGEQPVDAGEAEAGIRANWAIVHDFDGDPQSRRSYLDDDTGVVDAWTALQDGEYAEAASNSSADIKELVFTSPTEAWFLYDVLTPITNFYDRYGIARLGADGAWIFTRQTICQDIALAPGFGCAPPVEPLLPPSAASDPRYNPELAEEAGIVGD